MIEYNPRDWWKHLFDLKGSMAVDLVPRVAVIVIWAVAVVGVHVYYTPIKMGTTPHTLIGAVLGLLLVFRTNSSYDRWWEGRKLWGGIVNESRNLARLASVLLAGAPDLARRVIYWGAAFPWAVLHRLRGTRGLGPPADDLSDEACSAVLAANHPPAAVAQQITSALDEARRRGLLSDRTFAHTDQIVQMLVGYLGGCERIHTTPMPFAYMVHLRRALLLYLYTLPLALADTLGWSTLAVVAVVSFVMLGVEEIGVEIEDPFGHDDNDLPLERYCVNIERNMREMLTGAGLAAPPPGTAPQPALPAGAQVTV